MTVWIWQGVVEIVVVVAAVLKCFRVSRFYYHLLLLQRTGYACFGFRFCSYFCEQMHFDSSFITATYNRGRGPLFDIAKRRGRQALCNPSCSALPYRIEEYTYLLRLRLNMWDVMPISVNVVRTTTCALLAVMLAQALCDVHLSWLRGYVWLGK